MVFIGLLQAGVGEIEPSGDSVVTETTTPRENTLTGIVKLFRKFQLGNDMEKEEHSCLLELATENIHIVEHRNVLCRCVLWVLSFGLSILSDYLAESLKIYFGQ